jgi:hypothetical protein
MCPQGMYVGCFRGGGPELLLGVSRHLSAYSISDAHAALDSLQYASQIGRRQLLNEVLSTMEQLGWIQRCLAEDGATLVSVDALIPPSSERQAACSIW